MAMTRQIAVEHLLRRYFGMEIRRCLSTSLTGEAKLNPEYVLASKNRESCIRKLKNHPTMKVNEKSRLAAVLVPLCLYKDQLGLLYTLRSTKLNSDGGQVSFPGGRKDNTDKSLEHTALRETWEELRIPESQVDVWASIDSIRKKDLSVTAVFGYIGQVDPEKLQVNHHEVEEAFVVTLESLCDPLHFRFTQFRNGFVLPVYTGGKYRVWGFTAAITHMIMNSLVPEFYKKNVEALGPINDAMQASKKKSQQWST